MKRTLKRTLSLFLACVLLLGTFSAGSVTYAQDQTYQNGDVIEFGSYPQSQVTDEETLAALNAIELDWQSCGYYTNKNNLQHQHAGYDPDYDMRQSDFMQFADVESGNMRYRAVRTLSYYRGMYPYQFSSGATSYQDDAGFEIDTVYWFRWEPIQWVILDAPTGLVWTKDVLDAQSFNEVVYSANGNVNNYTYKDKTCTVFASDYTQSSIREWLSDETRENGFLTTAFTEKETRLIQTTVLDNGCFANSAESGAYPDCEDQIFLLSGNDLDGNYGFKKTYIGNNTWSGSNASAQAAYPSRYAEYQGAKAESSYADLGGTAQYLTRSAYSSASSIWTVFSAGYVGFSTVNANFVCGVRPAMRLDLDRLHTLNEPDEAVSFEKGDVIEFGSYPQSQVTDEETLAALDALNKEWVSYGYRIEYESGDFMRYADLELNGVRYRAVTFDQYRPKRIDTYVVNIIQTDQKPNGYETKKVYYFRYDPIRWIVVNEKNGLVFSEKVLDAHEYFNQRVAINPDNGLYYQDETYTQFASYWPTSELCGWLNGTFYDTAFSDQETQIIQLTTKQDEYQPLNLLNLTKWYGTVSWSEKVFLPTALQISPKHSGDGTVEDSAADYLFPVVGTEYAFCQGVPKAGTSTNTDKGNVEYFYTRTQGRDDYASVFRLQDNNSVAGLLDVYGVRPEIHIDLDRLTISEASVLSGTCGENVQWTFDEESGVLALSGTGGMYSLDTFSAYGYSIWQDEIRYVAVSDGVTSIGAHAFEGCPLLEEAVLGEDVTVIGGAAFTDCPHLMNVTLLSHAVAADGAFSNDRTDWMLIFPEDNMDALWLAKSNGARYVTVSFKDNILSFYGTITVFDGLAYSYLPMFVQRYGSAQKVFFERLVFADAPADSVQQQPYTSAYNNSLVLHMVEVTLEYIVRDGKPEEITYDRMLELLQSGDYVAFRLRIFSDGKLFTEETIEAILAEWFPEVPRRVLQIVAKAINFIVRIFKK